VARDGSGSVHGGGAAVLVGSGLSSGAAFDSDWAILLMISAGAKVIREEVFFDRDEALEAAGLRE
jgi:hypothetical protein